MKNKYISAGMLVIFVLAFSGCATMFRTNQVAVRAASGASDNVWVLENGVPIFAGPLPARIPVRGGRTYTVHFIHQNGADGMITISQRFNGWVIGSVLLGVLPVFVDLATGSVMTFQRSVVLPISYSPMIILGENIPYNTDLKIIGNIFYEETFFEEYVPEFGALVTLRK